MYLPTTYILTGTHNNICWRYYSGAHHYNNDTFQPKPDMDIDKEDANLLVNQYDPAVSYSAFNGNGIESSFSQTRESGRTSMVDVQPRESTSINTEGLPITNQQSSASTANSPQSPGNISPPGVSTAANDTEDSKSNHEVSINYIPFF